VAILFLNEKLFESQKFIVLSLEHVAIKFNYNAT